MGTLVRTPGSAADRVVRRSRSNRDAADVSAAKRRARRVTRLLKAKYGSPRHDNKDDPLDELVFIVLSQMTTHWSFGRVYDRLKARYPTWDRVLEAGTTRLARSIKDAGLSGQKAPRIIGILRRLRADFGSVTLQPLASMADASAERYLTS